MPKPDLSYALGLTPVEAVRYFRSKGIAVTENWHDLWQEAQARAFTVAGVAKLDLLQDIRGAVDAAIKEGKTEQWFLNELAPILKKKGWWGKKEVTNPDTGEVRHVRQGSPSRLKLIYRQNTQSAYMAGRYKQQIENADAAPYLRYIAVLDQKTRPAHAALHNMVFRFDDPFWGAMYPPNGWNCRCRVAAYSESHLKRRGLKVSDSAGHIVTREIKTVNRQTGEVVRRTVTGYRHGGKGSLESFTDAGFSYNPGKVWLEDALANVPEPAQAVTWKDMGLRPLRDVPAEERLPAPELLPIADSQEEVKNGLPRRWALRTSASASLRRRWGAALSGANCLRIWLKKDRTHGNGSQTMFCRRSYNLLRFGLNNTKTGSCGKTISACSGKPSIRYWLLCG